MLEVEVFGAQLLAGPLPQWRVERLCALALASAAVKDGHLAVQFVDEAHMAELNGEHRGKEGPTDVLSFPIDGADPQTPRAGVPRELGDVVICPAFTADVSEAIVHGTLHLVGMDHETDEGEMLALQAEIMRWGDL
ncbi:MAG TPA: rRNA maturation RNase YbeY [Solirubrobacteraceae bacterium]|jgi:probable rRNA maturation factor|nr:rRNA maturation RNase YbeY [Solirubrobacteraceae bacterium]